jgi:hypothetical protein
VQPSNTLTPPPSPTTFKTFHDAVEKTRQGYFYSNNFVPFQRAQSSRSAVTLMQALQPLVSSPYTLRYLKEAGFYEVENDPMAFGKAQEIMNKTALVLSINMVQRPYGYPSRLYRINKDLDGYLNDRTDQMEKFHLLGTSVYDAQNFQRLSSKLLWSVGAQETFLVHQEQEAFLHMLIDASQAPLRANLACSKLEDPHPSKI